MYYVTAEDINEVNDERRREEKEIQKEKNFILSMPASDRQQELWRKRMGVKTIYKDDNVY